MIRASLPSPLTLIRNDIRRSLSTVHYANSDCGLARSARLLCVSVSRASESEILKGVI